MVTIHIIIINNRLHNYINPIFVHAVHVCEYSILLINVYNYLNGFSVKLYPSALYRRSSYYTTPNTGLHIDNFSFFFIM